MEDIKKTQSPTYENLDVKVTLVKSENKLEIAEENVSEIVDRTRETIHNEIQKEKEIKNSFTEP